jgi:hypothetical protein
MNLSQLLKSHGGYVAVALGAAALLAVMAYWWFVSHTFYEETYQDTVSIAGEVYPVTEWRGVVSDKSPLDARACFLLRAPFEALEELSPRPTDAPAWFRCFNAQVIRENLATGYATAYVAESDDPPGFDRIVAVFPGGRSYMWRQPAGQ